ncbi:MAG: YceH family protein [Bacteroidia bacterium]
MDTNATLPHLDPVEIRVLGSLIEKSKTTPDYYPMTLNALTAACNQKTSRKPVVEYDEETVVIALDRLKKLSLIATATGGTSRSVKYRHNFTMVFQVSSAELAVLCLLFLRGPQTPGELNTNSARLFEFESIDEVISILQKLGLTDLPFVTELPRRPGQKETRFAHLFSGTPEQEEEELPQEPARRSVNELEARLSIVEQELAELKNTLSDLIKELKG